MPLPPPPAKRGALLALDAALEAAEEAADESFALDDNAHEGEPSGANAINLLAPHGQLPPVPLSAPVQMHNGDQDGVELGGGVDGLDAAPSPSAPMGAGRTKAKPAATAPAPSSAHSFAPSPSYAKAPNAKSAITAAAASNAARTAKPANPVNPANAANAANAAPTSASRSRALKPKATRLLDPQPQSSPQPELTKLPQPRARTRKASAELARLYVLDTNVLLHDPMALFTFEEHDIFLPMIVLEELDGHKKGMTEVARNGRQTSRMLDALVGIKDADITQGLDLASTGHGQARGKLFFQTSPLNAEIPQALPAGKADNQILAVLAALVSQYPARAVVLVTKDINMRVKARALGLAAEDYQSDKTLEDGDMLYSGSLALAPNFWTRRSQSIESWQSGTQTLFRISGSLVAQLNINQFVYFEAPDEIGFYARVTELREDSATLRTLKDYTHLKHGVWGIVARNREQNFALNLLMDPEIDFVTLAGTAGTGKTLMALAAGLTQVLDERRYSEIIMTRATVSMGEDIGFLPGTEEEKMTPWMGALDDNLEVLTKGEGSGSGHWERAATTDLIRSRIKIKSMNFMRGRTFLNKWVIIDEAQNLTPKQIKSLITRAGPGTKMICMGNLAQIDTPYLTEGSSGLTYTVDRLKGWRHAGHITLARGERSRLADFASEML